MSGHPQGHPMQLRRTDRCWIRDLRTWERLDLRHEVGVKTSPSPTFCWMCLAFPVCLSYVRKSLSLNSCVNKSYFGFDFRILVNNDWWMCSLGKNAIMLAYKTLLFTFDILIQRHSFLSYGISFGVQFLEFVSKIWAQVIHLEAKGKANTSVQSRTERSRGYWISSGSEQEKWNSGDAMEAPRWSCPPRKQVT